MAKPITCIIPMNLRLRKPSHRRSSSLDRCGGLPRTHHRRVFLVQEGRARTGKGYAQGLHGPILDLLVIGVASRPVEGYPQERLEWIGNAERFYDVQPEAA